MSYMLLIVEPVGQRQTRTPDEGRQAYASMQRFAEGLRQRGLLTGAESLASQATGARVSVKEGKAHIVDGPFAEAKEMIGGFFMLDVKTRDEAIEIARQCPAAAWCTVEVRALAPCYEDAA